MKRDVLQSNCQTIINRLSTIGTTLKSICVPLIIGLIAAYYGSTFFELFKIKDGVCGFQHPDHQSMSYIWAITSVFFTISFIVIVCFTFLSSYYLSVERGYVNMYEYAGMKEQYYMLNGTFGFNKPLGTDEVEPTAFPITSMKAKEYGGGKWHTSVDYIEKRFGFSPKSIQEFNDVSVIKRTRIISCFLSKSILPFYITILTLSFSIIAFTIVLNSFAK